MILHLGLVLPANVHRATDHRSSCRAKIVAAGNKPFPFIYLCLLLLCAVTARIGDCRQIKVVPQARKDGKPLSKLAILIMGSDVGFFAGVAGGYSIINVSFG